MQKNKIIYILIALIVVLSIGFLTFNKLEKEEEATIDTSMFNVVTTKDVNRMINNNETKMIIIGSRTCTNRC